MYLYELCLIKQHKNTNYTKKVYGFSLKTDCNLK